MKPNDWYLEVELWRRIMMNGTFSWALEMLKQGKKVARDGWNGKGMWIALVDGTAFIQPSKDSPYWNAGIEHAINIDPHIDMFTASGSMQPGWLASQADLLSCDWNIVD